MTIYEVRIPKDPEDRIEGLVGEYVNGVFFADLTLPCKEDLAGTFDLAFIETVRWELVFEHWKKSERGYWDNYFKERDLSSWEEWRTQYVESLIAPFGLQNRRLLRFKVNNPMALVPTFYAGAFPGWRKYYRNDVRAERFCNIVQHPHLPENPKVEAVRQNFPTSTFLIGVTDGSNISIFEGMHRCAAVALEAMRGQSLAQHLYIVLIPCSPSEVEFFKQTHIQVRNPR